MLTIFSGDLFDFWLFIHYSAPNFHLPSDVTKSLVLVGPGTGIAPFRSFWQHRAAQKKIKGILYSYFLFFFFKLTSQRIQDDSEVSATNESFQKLDSSKLHAL